MTKEYIFDIKNKDNWKGQKQAVGGAIQIMMDNARSSFVITVDEHKEIRGYWRLIGIITKHLNKTNLENWEVEDVSDMFKSNIGFTYARDNMLFWKKQYQNQELKEEYQGIVILNKEKELGKRYTIKTRSLKKNKGCTLADMEKLIGEVLRFGADIPDCELTTEEERGFRKYYGIDNNLMQGG